MMSCIFICEVVIVAEASQPPPLIVNVPYFSVSRGKTINGYIRVHIDQPLLSTCRNVLDVTTDAIGRFVAVWAVGCDD
jgi:hypothetical protein